MADSQSTNSIPARLALLAAVAWLLTWALFKLFKGVPADLPPQVMDLSPWDKAMTFRTVITVELIVAAVAIIWPRLGWFVLAVQFTIFIAVLFQLMAAGAETCGCTGSQIKLKPWQMAAVDGVLLVALIATRPWRAFRKSSFVQARIGALIPIAVLSLWLPYHKFRVVQLPGPSETTAGGAVNGAGETGSSSEANGAQNPQIQQPTGQWYEFKHESWEGQMWQDTDLYQFVDPPGAGDLIPPGAYVIVYRKSCEHCRDFISNLAMQPPDAPVVMIRVTEMDDANQKDVIELKPEHVHLELKHLPRAYDCAVPVTFEIDDLFMISNVESHKEE